MIVGYVKMGGVTLVVVSIHSNDVLHQIKKKYPTFQFQFQKFPTFQKFVKA